jgi:nucleoside-diphosphate-sugar epimerase
MINLRDLAELLVKVVGGGRIEMRSFPEERKKIDIGDFYSESRKIHDAVGWKPTISLEVGLTRTVNFFREHLHQYS